jgi:hypothetical protein
VPPAILYGHEKEDEDQNHDEYVGDWKKQEREFVLEKMYKNYAISSTAAAPFAIHDTATTV